MKIFISTFLLLTSIFCNAQQSVLDTSIKNNVYANKKNNVAGVATKLIFPVSLIAYGVITQNSKGLKQLDISTRNTINTNHPDFHTKVDNYLQFTPGAAVYALNLFGIKGKNNLRDRTIIYALSNLISTGMVTPLKHITKVTRPDGSTDNSFPSGHTTTAFANAEFLRQEYKDVSPWYGILGYAAAVTTGSLRVYNNRHWVSDVVAGAGFGILSTKLAYWIYPTIKKRLFNNKKSSALILPFYQKNNIGLVGVYHF
jgi:hypothetical protein